MRNSGSRLKPLKRPLRDVSNSSKAISAMKKSTPAPVSTRAGEDEGYSLERLLLFQSEISSVLHQIDGLVVQAFKLESMGESQKKEIGSFTCFLSDTLESLKPWVLRFQQLLSAASKVSSEPGSKLIKCDPAENEVENENDELRSPEVVKTKSLVSPSPLVSWRNNCTVQRGKRLFLLTPLPKSTAKVVLSNQHYSNKSALGKLSAAVGVPSRFALNEISNDNVSEKQLPRTPFWKGNFNSVATNVEKSPERNLESTSSFSFRDCSMVVMTPRFKMSPPRTCVLLEPVSETSHENMIRGHKSTPYPSHLQYSSGSEMSLCSTQVTEDLALRYPELGGINSHHELGNEKEMKNASFSWLTSPPKTCVLLELQDDSKQNNPVANSHLHISTGNSDSEVQQNIIPTQRNAISGNSIQGLGASSLIESTPLWKNLESTMRSGKRAGETTLKKELWTKFEAASIHEFSLYASPVEVKSNKGFLDLLEEVSGD